MRAAAVTQFLILCSAFLATPAAAQWELRLVGCPGASTGPEAETETETPSEVQIEAEASPAFRRRLTTALATELGREPSSDAPLRVTVHWGCNADQARVVVNSAGTIPVRVERPVQLRATDPHLQARLVAMVARDLVDAVRQLAAEEPLSAGPTAQPTPTRGAPAPVTQPPAAEHIGIGLLSGARMFAFDPPSLIGGGQLVFRWHMVGFFVSAEGARVVRPQASVDVFVGTAGVGIVPLRAREGVLSLSAGAYAEGGVVASFADTRVAGFVGGAHASPFVGALVRLQAGLRAIDGLDLLFAVDVGLHYGTRITALTVPLLRVDGISGAIRVGGSFRG